MRNMRRFRIDILARVFVDVVVVSLSGAVAMFARFSAHVPGEGDALQLASKLFGVNVLCLVPITVGVFSCFGLYTGTRGFPLWRKVLRVSEAVSLAFVIIAVLRHFWGEMILLPGQSLGIAWSVTLVVTVFGRVWARIWSYLVLSDEETATVLVNRGREKNVLLIGGAGYIGSALLPKLLTDGYRVRLLDSFVYGDGPIADWLHHRNLEIMRADFRQVDKVVEAMQGMGTVIHLGAIVGDPACALNEELTIEVNLVATRMIAEVAKGQGVSRFIFASTCSVYGVSDELLDERSNLNPVSLYARSKIACERVLVTLKDRSFLPVILRFGTIYGLSGRTRFDLVVNLLSAKALVEGEMTVYGSDQWRPFVHVDDAARAVLLATEANSADLSKMVFNVGSDEQNLTLGEVGSLILSKVPSAKLSVIDENVDKRNYRVNFRRIREELGFLPLWSISNGVDQVLRAIRSGQVPDYRVPEYSNVRFLKERGSDVLKVQNGWAKDLLETAWLAESVATRSSSLSLSGGE